MTFIYPLGLLGLIGVPILIIIYVIKNKYMEQTIPSTYVWTVSERFLKRKRPISQIAGIISLILQILAVVFISFSVAHPILKFPGQANDYCFMLDASGSMAIQENGETRFDKAKDEIKKIINSSKDGSKYTLIVVDDGVTVFDTTEEKEIALEQLDKSKVSTVELNLEKTKEKANEIFASNPATEIYFVTDENYETVKNITLITVASEEINHGIKRLEYQVTDDGIVVSGEVHSTVTESLSLNIEFYFDAEETPVFTSQITLAEGNAQFNFTLDAREFTSIKAIVKESDAYDADNCFVLYDIQKENEYEVLIVSEQPFFIKSVIEIQNGKTTVVSPDDYANETGYDLYVFDAFTPQTMPSDGAVWFFGIKGEVANSGFVVHEEQIFKTHEYLTLTDDTESLVETLTLDLSNSEGIAVTKFVKYGTYRDFTTLYSCQSVPVIFTGVDLYGYREVVFAFDLHDSNFPVLYDFPVLMRNLWEYSFPDAIDKTVYAGGEEIRINAIPNCTSIKVTSPSGKSEYLEMSGGASVFIPQEVGVFTITLAGKDFEKNYFVYSLMPESELGKEINAGDFIVDGTKKASVLDGVQDVIIVAFIILSVLFVADWMVYCYDKYQLR